MKKTITVPLCLLLWLANHPAYAQTWGWLAGGEGAAFSAGHDIAIDRQGYKVVCGAFEGTLKLGDSTLTSAGSKDAFIARFTPGNELQWAIRLGGTGDDRAAAVGVDGKGNAYIGGRFEATLHYNNDSIVSAGGYDILLAKIDTGGNIAWVKRAGSARGDNIGNNVLGQGLAVDQEGFTWITGTFGDYGGSPPVISVADFDTLTASTVGDADVFIAKYSPDGNIAWLRTAGSRLNETGTDIDVDLALNVTVSGSYNALLNFGSTTLPYNSNGQNITGNTFVVRYDSLGNLKWVKGIRGYNSGSGSGSGGAMDADRAISVDRAGNTFITGYYDNCGLVVGDGFTLAERRSSGGTITLIKYDTAGVVKWAKAMGGDSPDNGLGATTDSSGNVYITGRFGPAATFGSVTITGPGVYSDLFVSKWSGDGVHQWTAAAGGSGEELATSLALDPTTSDLYVTGYFNSPQATFGGNVLSCTGDRDLFIAQLSQPALSTGTVPARPPVRIYPNPAADRLMVQGGAAGYTNITLTDALGKTVLQQGIAKQANAATEVPLAGFANGVYTLQLLGGTALPQAFKVSIAR